MMNLLFNETRSLKWRGRKQRRRRKWCKCFPKPFHDGYNIQLLLIPFCLHIINHPPNVLFGFIYPYTPLFQHRHEFIPASSDHCLFLSGRDIVTNLREQMRLRFKTHSSPFLVLGVLNPDSSVLLELFPTSTVGRGSL